MAREQLFIYLVRKNLPQIVTLHTTVIYWTTFSILDTLRMAFWSEVAEAGM